MIKMGMMIGDRYEILEPIGNGGMSDVYKAKCHKLNRFVAVKVLKQEFSENTEFVSKFRTEAQAAAGLMHPNIVNVYDVGEEGGIYYIVMELVEGITLKRYIEKKARLSVKEAVSIAIQISMGIEAAHNNGIIHRDIKPQNIIISKEGKVKVTDFGIAKAATSNTITSNVMGSVHYTSPEQARGGFSDEKSDIYSMGITMFEMLTGRVPFNGETTVAIAIKHIQEEMPSPRNYVPEIPISVEQIVLKCTQKSPDRRYQKMPELIEDLKKSLISPNEDFVRIDNGEQGAVTRAVSETERAQIKQEVRQTGPISAAASNGIALQTPPPVQQPKRKVVDESASPVRRVRTGDEKESMIKRPEPEKVRKPRPSQPVKKVQAKPQTRSKAEVFDDDEEDTPAEKIKTIIIIVLAVIIGCLFIYFIGAVIGVWGGKASQDPGTVGQEQVHVPNIVGNDLEDAKKALDELGLKYEIEYQTSVTETHNSILSTDPEANEKVAQGTSVKLVVSNNGGVELPNVVLYSEAEATAALEREGFKVVKLEEQSNEIIRGNVISQEPAGGTLVARGSEVVIVISLGRVNSDISMPDLTNMTEEEAKAKLEELGLVCESVSETYDDNVEKGRVCYQSYTVGATIEKGTKVEIKLSMGPEPRYYSCDLKVDAPPEYEGGVANVVLKTPDGAELFNTTTSSFPVPIKLTQIYGVSTGVVTITFTIYVEQDTVDAAGNPITEMVPAQNYHSYEVTFE
ncbi:MAG: Stk1 family PASTA domain-containing Ser/Thr kinase [Lachnospiraceae bacterium]|nr:Stk1 family PASTA domain-containing Ser/Thr kinase [Lachnospiraceae bacterium]